MNIILYEWMLHCIICLLGMRFSVIMEHLLLLKKAEYNILKKNIELDKYLRKMDERPKEMVYMNHLWKFTKLHFTIQAIILGILK